MNRDVVEGAVADEIRRRAQRCTELGGQRLAGSTGYFLAGGCLTGAVRDIDVYPRSGYEFVVPTEDVAVTTRDATTIAGEPPVQFCRYEKSSLKALVESFDFAHVQVGASVSQGSVDDVYFTSESVAWRAIGDSLYMHSDYPLSSAIRTLKYHARGDLSRGRAIWSLIRALRDVVRRGFRGYEDFKDRRG